VIHMKVRRPDTLYTKSGLSYDLRSTSSHRGKFLKKK
jgi:hypothetical protein